MLSRSCVDPASRTSHVTSTTPSSLVTRRSFSSCGRRPAAPLPPGSRILGISAHGLALHLGSAGCEDLCDLRYPRIDVGTADHRSRPRRRRPRRRRRRAIKAGRTPSIAIAADLNARGIATPNGGQFRCRCIVSAPDRSRPALDLPRLMPPPWRPPCVGRENFLSGRGRLLSARLSRTRSFDRWDPDRNDLDRLEYRLVLMPSCGQRCRHLRRIRPGHPLP
jgi:hypothetical protein